MASIKIEGWESLSVVLKRGWGLLKLSGIAPGRSGAMGAMSPGRGPSLLRGWPHLEANRRGLDRRIPQIEDDNSSNVIRMHANGEMHPVLLLDGMYII